jgi:CRP-like cAMP-binding protein
MPDYSSLLYQADIFFQISSNYLEMISALCREVKYQAGEEIFLEGSGSDDLYVILQGEVDIQVNPGLVSDQPGVALPPVTIATLRRGQSFGEIALVDHGMRSATACAATNETACW